MFVYIDSVISESSDSEFASLSEFDEDFEMIHSVDSVSEFESVCSDDSVSEFESVCSVDCDLSVLSQKIKK